MKLLIALLALTVVSHAQTPAEPQLSATTQLALQVVKQEFETARQHLNSIELDIVKEHPGFHLDEATLTIVPNVKAEVAKPKEINPKK